MNNKKGFTLVELLAVIVILSVIILIAAINVSGVTNNAKKDTLAVEGNTLIDSAKMAHEFLLSDGKVGEDDSICLNLEELYKEGYYNKGSKNKYYGSVLIQNNNDQYTYKFWISNGKLKVDGAEYGANGDVVKISSAKASTNCNGLAPSKPVEPENPDPNPDPDPDPVEPSVPEINVSVNPSKSSSLKVGNFGGSINYIYSKNMSDSEVLSNITLDNGATAEISSDRRIAIKYNGKVVKNYAYFKLTVGSPGEWRPTENHIIVPDDTYVETIVGSTSINCPSASAGAYNCRVYVLDSYNNNKQITSGKITNDTHGYMLAVDIGFGDIERMYIYTQSQAFQ